MSSFIIEAKGLGKTYKDGISPLEVLRGIDLRVVKNEFLAIQGPSGAGKSTLLHILGGLDYPTKGEVLFEGENLYSFKENELATFRNRKVGFVFQFYHLLPEFDVLENVIIPSLIRSWWEKKKVSLYARSLLERLGLTERLHHTPNQLSGGEQQRVAIARALINKPQLLLCDEPTGNLDSESGRKILSLLRQLNQEAKTTVILVTHDKDIAGIADRVIYLKDGMLVN
jgi:ABC-type lipoprotein export system ATPase subunit